MRLFAQTTDIKVVSINTAQHVIEKPATNTCVGLKEREKLYSSLPYRKGESSFKIFSTLGQLSKLCDWVVIGTLTNTVQNGETNAGNKAFGNREITINVETNLFGGYLDKQVTARLSWFNVHHELKPGDRLILFLAKSNFGKYRQKQLFFDFSKTNLSGKASDMIFVVEGSRGVIQLDGKTDEKVMSTTIHSYLQVLRSPNDKKALAYYFVLKDLTHSHDLRIKMDAISDLILLLQFEKSLDLIEIGEDPSLLPEIKDFIRLILIPSRTSKH